MNVHKVVEVCKPTRRKRISPPKDPTLIELLNGKLENFHGRARNFLTRPPHEKAHGKPKFDSYRFKNDKQAKLAELAENVPTEVGELFKFLTDNVANKGASLPAEWQGANVGDEDPRVTHKIGTDTSREALVRAAEAARTPGAIRKTYGDIRSSGKIRCAPDVTYVTAAYRETYQKASRRFSVWKEIAPQPCPDWSVHYRASGAPVFDGVFIDRHKTLQISTLNFRVRFLASVWVVLWVEPKLSPCEVIALLTDTLPGARPKPDRWYAFIKASKSGGIL
jgi:hypothetical protein